MSPYRPLHSTVTDRTHAIRTVLFVVVLLELLIASARITGMVIPRDGAVLLAAGVVGVSPSQVGAGDWAKLRFAVRAGADAIENGRLVLEVPLGWTPPSTGLSDPGLVTASSGTVSVVGQTIQVTGVRLQRSSTLVVTYGGGSGGATEPIQAGRYRFAASLTANNGTWSHRKWQGPIVSVSPPISSCQSTSRPGGGGPKLQLRNGVVQPNLHNTWASVGSVQQCSGPSGVTNKVSLDHLKPISYGPAGYPEVAYGYNLEDQPFCGTCPSQPFPLPVSDLGTGGHDLRLSVTYAVAQPSPASLPRDFIYDIWLEQEVTYGKPPSSGDLELLIFLYQQGIAACGDGAPVAHFSAPLTINQKPVFASWHACQIHGGTQAAPIAFFLDDPAQSDSGQLTLSIRDFVDAAANYLDEDLSHHSLLGVEVGGEFDQCSVQQGCQLSQLSWGWIVQQLTILDSRGAIPVVFPQGQPSLR